MGYIMVWIGTKSLLKNMCRMTHIQTQSIFKTMIRTRAIIQHLSYDILAKQGVIPDLVSVVAKAPTKRYPPFVYKGAEFAQFGVIMDYIVRAGLRINLRQPVELGNDPTANA